MTQIACEHPRRSDYLKTLPGTSLACSPALIRVSRCSWWYVRGCCHYEIEGAATSTVRTRFTSLPRQIASHIRGMALLWNTLSAREAPERPTSKGFETKDHEGWDTLVALLLAAHTCTGRRERFPQSSWAMVSRGALRVFGAHSEVSSCKKQALTLSDSIDHRDGSPRLLHNLERTKTLGLARTVAVAVLITVEDPPQQPNGSPRAIGNEKMASRITEGNPIATLHHYPSTHITRKAVTAKINRHSPINGILADDYSTPVTSAPSMPAAALSSAAAPSDGRYTPSQQ